jgi:hypothetical protein
MRVSHGGSEALFTSACLPVPAVNRGRIALGQIAPPGVRVVRSECAGRVN